MSRYKLSLVSSIMVLGLFLNPSIGCEPCHTVLDFYETAEAADIIVIASRTDFKGPIFPFDKHPKPESMKVKIELFYKGNIEEEEIVIFSYDSICSYGGIFVDDDKPHVMFLKKGETMYSAVFGGCALTTLPIENNKVLFEDQSYSKETFAALLPAQYSACPDGTEPLGFQQTVDSADVIIIGTRIDSNPVSEDMHIKVKIDQTFKGSNLADTVIVNIINGMWSDELLRVHTPHVMFLENAGNNYTYVAYGCNMYSIMRVNDGHILFKYDGHSYSIDGFSKLLNNILPTAPRKSGKADFFLNLSREHYSGNFIIEYILPEQGRMTLEVTNVLGKSIILMKNKYLPAGSGFISLAPENLFPKTGPYYLRVISKNTQIVKRVK